MALVNSAAITAALATLLDDDVTTQINRSVVVAQILDVGTGNGKNVSWDVSTGTALPGTAVIADGADVAVFNNDDKRKASLEFGTYHDAFGISGKAMAEARNTGNPRQLAALFTEYMGDSMERLAFAIADGVYNGDGSADTIHGMHDATIPALGDTGTYAGINRATVSQFQGNVIDAAAAPISYTLMNQLARDCFTGSGFRNDVFITDPIQHEKIASLAQQERRYVDEVKTSKGIIKLDGGYNVLYHGGRAILEDVLHPANTITALNTRYAKLHQLPDQSDQINGAMGMVSLGGSPEEQMGSGKTSLVARIQPLAKTGDSHKFALYCFPQLQIKRPNAMGFISNLAP